MTAEELYTSVIADLAVPSIHPLHQAILEECCENALANDQGITGAIELKKVVHLAFLSALAAAKGILLGALTAADADQATLQYRGRTFVIPANSTLLKD
ncbi:hypothetical protein [Hymenobacter pini]|uniref:hypothetical protein n=1 Tax=Hymenobacter pini TaxID=2880879 RepID=UPI001CF5BE5F|nr:hypothetical protein [Hymenobacter pini]MCA8833347.1 hypothetical protein [Hymenobacter pini]